MDKVRDHLESGRAWARDFLFGDYRGAPVDYLMALAIVFASMLVVLAGAV